MNGDSIIREYQYGGLWAQVQRWHNQYQAIVGRGDAVYESKVTDTEQEGHNRAVAFLAWYSIFYDPPGEWEYFNG